MSNIQMGKGSKELNYTFKLDIDQAQKKAKEMMDSFAKLNNQAIKSSDGFSGKPLTEYQAGLLKIKQDTLDFAKAKAEQARIDKENAAANKSASLATQKALQEEIRLRKEAAALPRKVDFGNSSAEVSASMASNSTGGVVNPAFTQYLKQVKADFDAGKISAAQYTAELERYSTVLVEGSNQTRNAAKATKDLTLSKKELEIIAAQEKLNAQQNAAALKNSVREMNAAKGSIEQRRAALIRLNTVYDNLNASERNSASGQRLKGIVGNLTTQVKTLEAETGRAQRNVGNYTSAFSNGATKAFSALKTVANILPGVGLAGLLGFAIEPIMKYISSLGLFKDKIDQILETRKELSNANLKGAQDAQTEIVQLKVLYDTAKNVELSAEQRFKAAKKLQEQYPDTFKNYSIEQIQLGKVDAAYLSLASAILATARARASEQKIAENSARALGNEQVITDERTKVEGLKQDLLKTEAVYERLAKKGFKDIGSTGVSSDQVVLNTKIAQLKNKIADSDKIILNAATDTNILNERNLKLTENIVDQQKKGADIVGGNSKVTSTKIATANLNAQRTLQAEIDALTKKAQFKSASDDEQELAAIDAKYDKLREKAIAFNNDVIKFNADAKNKIKKQQVDIGGLGIARTNEKDVLIDKQAASTLKVSLAEQKKLYDEYESYKLKVGAENAKELADKNLDTQKTYLEYLQGLEEQLTNDPKAKGGTGEAGKEQQLKVLRESIAAQEIIQEKADRENYANLLASLVTYEQQRATLIEKYNENRAKLVKDGKLKEVTVLDSLHKTQINQLDDQNNEKLTAYKALFSDVEKLSKDSLKKIIDDGEKLLAKQLINGSISPEMAKKTAEQIANLKEKLDNATSEGLVKIGNELRNLGGIIGQTNEGFGKWISTLGGVVGGISDISSKITALKKLPKGDVLGGISGGLGIAGAAFGVFQAVAGLLDKSAEQDEARKRATDYQIKQQDAMNKLLERQVALIQDAYGTGKLLKYSEALSTATENEKKYLGQLKGRIALTGDKNFDKAIENYNNGLGTKGLNIESGSIYKSLINGNFGSLKDKILDVNGSIEDLYKLLDNSSLDDATRNLLENLIKSKEAIIEINNSIKEERTGTSFKQLGDDIVDALSRGEDAAKSFEDAIRKAMINSLKSDAFKVELQKFYDQFALLSENGLTASEISTLRAQYSALVSEQEKRQKDLENVTGIKLKVDAELNIDDFKTNAFSLLLQSAEETGKSIEDILKDSILEGLKAQIFTDALKPLQAKIAALYKDGRIPTKEELAAITAEYTAFIDGAKAKLKEVEDATGLVFGEKIGEDLRAAAEKIKYEIQSISDSILDVFANSENALQDFESKFNGMVKNTILKSLQETTLQGRLTDFYTEFQKLSTVSDAEKEAQVAKLRAQYNAIIKEGKDEYERLQDVFGVDYGSSASKPSAAIGEGVQRITEDTANAIAGPIIGTFEQATKIANLMGKHYAIATQALDMAVKTEANTRRGANAGENALPLLNEIARNTRPKQGSSLSDSYSKI